MNDINQSMQSGSAPNPSFRPADVARRLTLAREALGLKKSEMADSVGIDRSSYTKIENGDKVLNADMAFAIAERWGVSMDYLYRGRLTDLPASIASKLRNL